MSRLPRVAVGSIQASSKPQAVSWALMGALTDEGCHIQHFASRCCHELRRGAEAATGQNSRHLDSWLMTPSQTRDALVRGLGSSELAVLDGCFDDTFVTAHHGCGGRLSELCQWLDMPRLAVLDLKRVRSEGLPPRPAVDGVLLDHCQDDADYRDWAEQIQLRWGLSVLGGLDELAQVRQAITDLPLGAVMPDEIRSALSRDFARRADLAAIRRLGNKRALKNGDSAVEEELISARRRPLTMAVAYDEAFHCYFPDMLERLEEAGVSVVDFSPLHDEQLPIETDVVYLGCGNVDRFAIPLSENHCLMTALRNHVCAGRRIFADGGGLAYLCQHIETLAGRWVSMVGALPAVARLRRDWQPLQAVEVTLRQSSWLREPQTVARGYLNPNWCIEPSGSIEGYVLERAHEFDVVGCYAALGTRLQINLATQPRLWRQLLSGPHN